MSRRLVAFLGGAIMLAMAVLVARVFREPISPLPGEETAQVGDSVSGSLQTAPQASLPSPLPSPDAMRMTSGDSSALPVTRVEAQPTVPAGVASVVEASASAPVQVTEAPVPPGATTDTVKLPAAPQDAAPSLEAQAESGKGKGASPASPAPAPAAQPAPEVSAPAAPAPQAGTPPAPDTEKGRPSSSAGAAPAAKAQAAASASPASSPSAAASSSAGTSDSGLKPGTLVTKSSLPARAGTRVVTGAVLTMDGDVVTLKLQGNDAMRGKAFMLTEPDRVVLDLEGDWKMEVPRVPSNRMVKALRTGRQGAATRLVFDMRVKPVKVDVTKPGASSLELTIR
ncbi:MAG: AMIN domain-containing protein [Desulfovibrionaceae bacterium]|nr:AMIN domain-containing protein [Desulfovibrionaceae bacterium]